MQTHKISSLVSPPAAVCAMVAVLLTITGCSSVNLTPSTGSSSSPEPGSPQYTLRATVIGGRKPVSGSSVSLVEAGTSGKASSTVLATTTTDSQGDFNIPNSSFTCHYPESQIYLTASGGDAGNGPNPNILLSAMLGPCKSIPNRAIINEFSTAGAAYAFSQFFDKSDVTKLGADGPPGTDQYIGISNAGALLTTNLVDVTPGAPSPTLGAGSNPEKILNSVADILVYCVNSPAPYTNCNTLFSTLSSTGDKDKDGDSDTAKNSGSGSIKNTLAAAVYLAQHPAKHTSDLFNLLSKLPVSAPYTPFLTSAPDSFLLALTYKPGDLDGIKQIAVDQPGNIWIANGAGNSISELSPVGTEISPSGGYKAGGTLNGPDSLVFDSNGNLWITNNLDNTVVAVNNSGSVVTGPFGSSSTFSGPKGIALDSFNQVWVANNTSTDRKQQLTVSTTAGVFSFFVGDFGLDMPVGLAADTTLSPNVIWASNSGDKGVSWIIDNGPPKIVDHGKPKLKGGKVPGGGQEQQGGITLDNCGDAWVTNTTGSVTEIVSKKEAHPEDDNGNRNDHYFAIGPIAVGGINSTSNPFGITTDSANHIWVLNQGGNSVTELSTRGKALSPASGFTALGAINGPYNGLAVDRSGNVWIANAGNNTITEFVGSAAPVATPRTQGRPVSPSGTTSSSSSSNTNTSQDNACPNPCNVSNGNNANDDDGGHGGCGGGDGKGGDF